MGMMGMGHTRGASAREFHATMVVGVTHICMARCWVVNGLAGIYLYM